MKKFFFLLAFMTLSLSAWAGPNDPFEFEATTWVYDSQHSNAPENVLRIKVRNGGALAQAYAEISADGWFIEKDNGPGIPRTQLTLSDFKVVHIENDVKPNANPIDAALNDADVAVLPNFQFETIDLQDAFYYNEGEKSAFTFTNSYVKNLILPDGWTKVEVNACASQIGTSLNAAFSVTPVKNGHEYEDGATMHAYIQNGNTLDVAIHHIITDTKHDNKKLMVQGNQYNTSISKLRYLSVSGYPVARDLASIQNKFDADGHLVFNEPASEAYGVDIDPTLYASGPGVSGNARQLVGELMNGALFGASLYQLDLGDAIIENQYCEDLTLGQLGSLNDKKFYELIIPTYEGFNKLPADFFNIKANFEKFQSILIPRNITSIGTRAFLQLTNLKHIYTEGDTETTVYDNGAVTGFDDNGDEVKVFGSAAETATLLYGTITLGGNIQVIESHAFGGQTNIKDVYVLALPAPECHVDAFNTVQYVANDAYDRSAITDGIITREAYTNNKNEYTWMAMLHYPREAGTPDIQRYTDVTRTYSVATGLRDGKGAILYMPNQYEYCRAYLQGTFGYLWNAWDPTRVDDGTNSFVDKTGDNMFKTEGYSTDRQIVANDAYINNNFTEIDKTDRSFYDVTENGLLTKPEGLQDYWETVWEGTQLYPQAVTEGTGQYQTVIKKDAQGNYIFVVDNDGSFIKVGTYTADDNGTFVREYDATEAEDGADVKNMVYREAAEGEFYYDAGYKLYEDGDTGEQLVRDYQYVVHDSSDGTNGAYYRPYVQNGNTSSWTEGVEYYTYEKTFKEEENGEYVHLEHQSVWNAEVGANVPYVKLSDWQSWMGSYTEGVFYSLESAYVLWDGNTDIYKVLYTLSDSFSEYTEAAGDVTTYDKVYAEPVTYRTYNSETDASEDIFVYYDNGYVEYTSEVGDVTRYNYVWDGSYRPFNPETDQGVQRYNTTYTYRAATDDDTELQHYSVATTYVDAAEEANLNAPDQYRDGTDLYAYDTEEVEIMNVTVSNDYRGWHQFVLTAYATNSNEPFVPYRSYITDSDWWTICVPFDLTKRNLIKLFGKNDSDAHADLPYLSKLTYVIRDAENKHIILNFSKNLLENKEVVADGHVHGVINEGTEVGLDDVVLHAGVPYLIRPNLKKGASRQFDIYQTASESDALLYERIMASQKMGGTELNNLIYNGIYTVPAYVVNNESNVESVFADNQTFVMGDGTEMTYTATGEIEYKGETKTYGISDEFRYSFVGSFFLNLMPKDAYFLGWDSNKNKAAFWYNRVPDTRNWTWNNETGIILPNFVDADFNRICDIDPATGLDDPARWIIDLGLGEDGDNVKGATNGVKNYTTESRFGYQGNLFNGEMTVIMQIDDENIDQIQQNNTKGVYSISGQFIGTSTEGLAKGIYIVNGKKYVIK